MAVERYRVQVDGAWMDVTLEPEGERVKVQCNDKAWDADLQQFLDTNLVSLILGGRSLEFLVDRLDHNYSVLRDWEQYDVQVKPAWTGTQGPADLMGGVTADMAIDSPLVGLVAEIDVRPGQEVERGDLLLVIEAMKMQNEIRAPRAGVVKAVRVKQGQKVSIRQLMIVLA